MFLHFGILTFCGSQPGDPCPGMWAQANLAIDNFNPSALYDPGQWADAAVVGSALVTVIAEAGASNDLDTRVEEYVRWLKS